jgi:hypothetical protein
VDRDPGSYRLIGERSGYLETAYGAHGSGGDGSILRLEPGQNLNNLKFKLAPSAVIAGTVRDSDQETMDAWRTSCPKLPVWEDANDYGLVCTESRNGRSVVHVTPAGFEFLRQTRPERV